MSLDCTQLKSGLYLVRKLNHAMLIIEGHCPVRAFWLEMRFANANIFQFTKYKGDRSLLFYVIIYFETEKRHISVRQRNHYYKALF